MGGENIKGTISFSVVGGFKTKTQNTLGLRSANPRSGADWIWEREIFFQNIWHFSSHQISISWIFFITPKPPPITLVNEIAPVSLLESLFGFHFFVVKFVILYILGG